MILGSVLAFVGAMLGHLVVFTLGLGIAFWVHAKRGPKNAVSTKKKMAVLLMLFMLCLTMFARYFSVLRWHLDCDFGGVWCLDVTSIHNRQYQTILHTCGQ